MGKTVEIVCVLDRSGSMAGMVDEVIGGFNNFLDEQKKVKGKAKLTLVLFDDQYEVVHDRVKLKDVPELTRDVYFTRGMTALYDAVGKTMNNAKDKNNGIFLVQTDGHENSSHEYTNNTIKKMIKKREKKGWKFVFLGADMNAMDAGANLGFGNTIAYGNNDVGNAAMYSSMSTMAKTVRGAVADNLSMEDVNVFEDVDSDELDINKSKSA